MKRQTNIYLILILSFLLSMSNCVKGQTTDSVSQSYSNGVLSVHMQFSSGSYFDISSINHQNISDTLKFDVCIVNGLVSVLTVRDTTVQFVMAINQLPNHYVINLYDNTNCTNLISSDYFQPNDVTSVDEKPSAINNSINLYPNPTKDFINLKIENNLTISKITLYDITGRVARIYDTLKNKLNTEGLNKGQYFLKIETKDGLITKKVQIN